MGETILSNTVAVIDGRSQLSCCPGGFSSYVLDKNPRAIGHGVSLPVNDGGHEFALESHHRSRYRLTFVNLTYYQLGPSTIDDDGLFDLPDQLSQPSFDLVILDGHQLRTQASARPWDSDRLIISQMIISLQSVKKGGTIIVKLPHPHKPLCAKILYLFRIIAQRVWCWKPRSMHASRGSCYGVATGVGRGKEAFRVPGILRDFKRLWLSLTFGGEDGLGRFMTSGDLDFVITIDELIRHHLDWLMKIGTPSWTVQGQALHSLYQKKGIL